MKVALIAYAFALIGLLIIDGFWLSLMTPFVYRNNAPVKLLVSPDFLKHYEWHGGESW